MGKKATYPKWLLKHARRGDRIVNRMAKRWCAAIAFDSAESRGEVYTLLQSNALLATFEERWDYRHMRNRVRKRFPKASKVQGRKGDRIEAYISWVEMNFGYHVAEAYYRNQVRKYIHRFL